jgi:hypothetical protein
MRTKLTAVAALAATGATLAAVAAAGPVAVAKVSYDGYKSSYPQLHQLSARKQRIAIESRCSGICSFVLTPLTAGAVRPDTGTVAYCCWNARFITRDGQKVEIDAPVQGTFTGKRGTFAVSQQLEWLDVPGGYGISTGTWKVVRGTGDYARLSGGGRHAGLAFPDGATFKARDEGFLSAN